MLTTIASAVLLLAAGFSLQEIQMMGESGMNQISSTLLRGLLGSQHILTFILPAIVFALLFYHPDWMKGLGIAKNPGIALPLIGTLFLLVGYPLVNLAFMMNEAIDLPAWAIQYEDAAADTLRKLMDMDSPWIFLANILIIAVLPGIGEELIFRGIIQKELGRWTKNPVIAIWVTGFIFSAIHLQFEGLLPRMALGIILGYLYYWSRNLWVPIIAHAINNGLQVCMIYFMGMDVEEVDQQTSQLEWWMLPVSILLMYLLYTQIKKQSQLEPPDGSPQA